jgi:hypothetical protein
MAGPAWNVLNADDLGVNRCSLFAVREPLFLALGFGLQAEKLGNCG